MEKVFVCQFQDLMWHVTLALSGDDAYRLLELEQMNLWEIIKSTEQNL